MEDTMNFKTAMAYLGISHITLQKIIRQKSLTVLKSDIDARNKFLLRAEVEALKDPTKMIKTQTGSQKPE